MNILDAFSEMRKGQKIHIPDTKLYFWLPSSHCKTCSINELRKAIKPEYRKWYHWFYQKCFLGLTIKQAASDDFEIYN